MVAWFKTVVRFGCEHSVRWLCGETASRKDLGASPWATADECTGSLASGSGKTADEGGQVIAKPREDFPFGQLPKYRASVSSSIDSRLSLPRIVNVRDSPAVWSMG